MFVYPLSLNVKDIELHHQKEWLNPSLKGTKKGQINSIFLDDFRNNRSRSLLNVGGNCFLSRSSNDLFMHSIENRKLEKWEVIFQRHTQPHVQSWPATKSYIQQNSDQNLPLRNICLIKSGLHHSMVFCYQNCSDLL